MHIEWRLYGKPGVSSVPLAAGEVCIDVTTGHTCFAAIREFAFERDSPRKLAARVT